jgi:hypothetical protein
MAACRFALWSRNMLGLFLNAAILYALVWIVARDTAELDFLVMVLIAIGVSVAGWVLGMAVGDGILGVVAIIPILGLLAFLLMKYCYISLQQALIVTGIYFVYLIGFALLLQPALR